MRAWKFIDEEDFILKKTNKALNDGEIKIKVSKAMLSRSDIFYAFNNDLNVNVPSHSAIGFVSEKDDNLGLKLGDKVCISPFVARNELGNILIKVMGIDEDGFLQDFVNVPAENVFPLPDGITDEEALFADNIAFAINVLEKTKIKKGDFVVIAGASTLGLITAQVASYYQMIPILIDFDSEKLKLASGWGISYTLNTTIENVERKVEEITGGRMCDAVVYAGNDTPFNTVVRLVKQEGEIFIAGYTSFTKYPIEMTAIQKKSLTIRAVSDGYGEMPTAINLLANKIIKVDKLVDSKVEFEKVGEMVDNCKKYPYMYNKIVVEMD